MANPDPTPFLGVTASVTGRRWIGPGIEQQRLADSILQMTGLPLPVAQCLARRRIGPEAVEDYLSPKLKTLLPDPRSLRDMEKAAERLRQAVAESQRIAIFADYDVDGGSSAALLLRWLRGLGRNATLYIPDRIDEGYGPNVPAMQDLSARHDLIICVDCGTVSHAPLAAASCDVLVLDHHLAEAQLPPAFAVVNPNRTDESGDLGHLCAAAVVFLLLVEANRQNRAAGQPCPDLMGLLDLVALATVADVAPLIGVNRAFVTQGLTVMARRHNPGLVALADCARLDRAPAAYHLGFVFGPRINAGGRVGKADLGARLLATDSPEEAAGLAARLEELNTERREIEAQVRDAALAQIETRGSEGALVWACGEDWHPGVVGIVASRVKEATGRPAVIIGLVEGEGKGSGRSVAGIDLGACVQKVAQEGLLLKGGGHRMAAGLSVDPEKIEPAMDRLEALLAEQGADRLGPADLVLEAAIAPAAATEELVTTLDQAGPFGPSSPAPRLALSGLRIKFLRRVGETHLKLSLTDGHATVEAICFGAFDGPLGPFFETCGDARLHVAGRLDLNHWQGRVSVQLQVEDAALA
ncbi:MAG: single-stranded-DNA-specific exonuclease RecJ [Mangrovicoccus sp.]